MLCVPLLGTTVAQALGTSAAFEQAPCPFELPASQVEGETVTCGYVSVPEKHGDPSGRTIRLAVAIFHPSGGATSPDPILFLSGGPGGSQLKILSQPGAAVDPWLGVAPLTHLSGWG